MRALAHAKVNLALAVYPPTADGFHPLRGIFQSVSLSDTVTITSSSSDAIEVSNDEAPADESNLAWRALDSARRSARVGQPAALSIIKRIPSGAGLGGGSADAAAALGLVAGRFGLDDDTVGEIAEGLGSDVPFAVLGGSCLAEGRGERLTRMPPLTGFALALVVPPFAMSTPAVFARWDAMGGPEGVPVPDEDLPPVLRGGSPIRNDLFPAAVSIDERIGSWASDLAARWGTAVAMTGSGSALFAFFPSLDEATSAAEAFDVPSRLAVGVEPVDRGWEPIDG
jgi:4-diphosphocytidyl-2-C-methyl-D-erythritol kinase